MINWLRLFYFLVLVVFGFFSFYLENTGLQYYVSLLIILMGGFIFIVLRNRDTYLIDVGWMICLAVSVVYVLEAIYSGKRLEVIALQCLVFLLPLSQYITKVVDVKITTKSIVYSLVFLCVLKIPTFLLNYQEVIESLTSASGRVRFHDFLSISLVFLIFPVFLYFRNIKIRLKLLLGAFFVVFIFTAAHRSAYLAVIAQFFIWLLVYSGVSRAIKVRTMVTCLVVVPLFFIFTSSGQVMLSLVESSAAGGDGNTNARLSLYYSVVMGWFDYFWGHGFGEAYAHGVNTFGDSVYYALHHNSYLTPLYFLGVIPATLFAASTIYLLFMPLSNSVESIYFRSVLVGMSIFGILNLWFEHPIFALSYWFVFGFFKKTLSANWQDRI